MAVFRMYTGEDNETHLEAQDLESHPILKSPVDTRHIMFREMAADTFVDWHPAPQRQYVIILEGELEIGFGDGTTHRFGKGDARLVEDTTGHGHTTRAVGNGPVLTAVVPLA
jgi:quercetin dioxygenase-like cupin family protein